VLIMGIVNLFGDMTYEGGASINGPYLGTLGASAAAISIIAGAGEFFGYSMRSVAGYIADKTGRYWLVTFTGYAINLLAVPAMAIAGSWQLAAALILAERVGRAMRKPTVEAMLSYTTGKHGRGRVYGVNTALDEIGATLGPPPYRARALSERELPDRLCPAGNLRRSRAPLSDCCADRIPNSFRS
jgi:MFS family permease